MREHRFSVGQIGVVMIVASEKKKQAKIVHTYCLRKLEKSKVLRKLIKNVTKGELCSAKKKKILTTHDLPSDLPNYHGIKGEKNE